MIKINVVGKGMYVPILKSIVPVYNVEADKAMVNKLLDYRTLQVYKSDDSVLITRANLDAVFSAPKVAFKAKTNAPKAVHASEAKPVAVVKEEPKPVVEEPAVVEEVKEEAPVVEETTSEEPVAVGVDLAETTETVVEETTDDTAEEATEDISEETADTVEETNEETTEEVVEEKPAYQPKNKKKKNHRNNG